ncbi:ABC transporter permease [Salmonella enterica]|nr:ABC transporter permease [Salmonella enterica]EBQ9477549.1 ABC transporter permease [Salmonella enterica subsp. enterica serovar Kokomlemle]EBU8697064.1 ABC transporter permease [Salmonella enterica subsp. enterica serovar Kokomlemle]ECX4748829.1 ABC transporter permease [Salmonella enterica]EGJ5833486.1 ABC transporter permease [Salmonella enterica]
MMVRLKLALRNLFRNKRRTLVSVTNLALALAAILLFSGFCESMYQGLRESMIRSQLGHIQLFKQGFNQFGALSDAGMLLPEPLKNRIVAQAQALPDVEIVTSRLETDVLITNGDAQMSSHIVGIDPDKEAVLSSAIQLLQGSNLFPEQQDGVLLGAALAKALKVKVGDSLTLLGTSANQTINAMDVTVIGIVTTGVQERDLRTAYANLSLVENFLLSKGATRVVILLNDTAKTDRVSRQLLHSLQNDDSDFELRTWSELATYYHQVVGLFSAIFTFVNVILLVVAAFAVSHALSMNVVERTREIGVIRAIGASRSEVVGLFVMEGGMLGVAGGVLGVLLAWTLAALLNQSGLMMPTPPGNTVTYPLRILLTPLMCLYAFAASVFTALVCSVLPAARAGKLIIIRALNHA